MDENYDVVVLGTGMEECVLSGLLSVYGKKVLHVDRNPYYGGESTSMNLNELYQKFRNEKPPENLGPSREYCVDSILKLIMADDGLVRKLRCSKVYKYLSFDQVDGSYVYRDGKIYKVPATDKEVLSSSLLSIFQKRYLHKLISGLEKCDLSKGEVPEGITPNTPMADVYKHYGLNDDNKELIGHVLALYQNDNYLKEPCINTFRRMELYKTSLEMYGKSPYIYPQYGLGEIPQAFARLSAVYGGTYMLNTCPTGFEFDEAGKVSGVKFGESTVKTKLVICDPSYFPEKTKKVKQVVRCICLMNHPLTAISPSESGQIIIPASQCKRKTDIYVSIISPSFNTSPKGIYIGIISTEVENSNPELDVKIGIGILSPLIDKFINTYDVYEPTDDGTANNIFISKSYDATTHFESSISDIDSLWKRITGEDFDEKIFADKTQDIEQ